VNDVVLAPLLEKFFPAESDDANNNVPMSLRGRQWTASREQFLQWVEQDQKEFSPVGEKVFEYEPMRQQDEKDLDMSANADTMFEVYKVIISF
jgi:hypothetical protein